MNAGKVILIEAGKLTVAAVVGWKIGKALEKRAKDKRKRFCKTLIVDYVDYATRDKMKD